MDVHAYNQRAWDLLVQLKNRWTIPVGSAEIERARQGDWSVVLTPTRPVPRDWFPNLEGVRVLCLASGGGQQAPILAAAGATVTVFDASPRQLAQDRFVAERDNLELTTIQGDMSDLSQFADGEFQLVFHPCSNCFVPDVRKVWRECSRVLCENGVLLAGVVNPVRYLFGENRNKRGLLEARFSLPYSDLDSLPKEECENLIKKKQPLIFGHSLEDQIGGQIDAGFVIVGFYEDKAVDPNEDPVSRLLPSFIATRALKTQIQM